MPDKKDVSSRIHTSNIVHFACHGESILGDPSSSFLAHNDWQMDPFTVADLTALDLEKAQFAYLSACR
jgi:CHAT domain-containing protein